jgi:UDPglucose 6-dehydrogenase
MLATRISFMNQVAALCEAAGADINMVRRGIGSDPRIGASFLYAGAGYGGSCFPKDVRALIQTGEEMNVDLSILKEVHETNARQKRLLGQKIRARFGDDLTGRSFAVWGLAFKPETDDMREAASVTLIEELLEGGATVTAHDPVATDVAREWYLGDRIEYAGDEYTALAGADALIVITEWLQYRRPDWQRIKVALAAPIVFDGRNLYDPARMRRHGFEYYPIGREQVR